MPVKPPYPAYQHAPTNVPTDRPPRNAPHVTTTEAIDLVTLCGEMEEAGLVKPRLVAIVSEMTSVDGFIKYFGDGAHEVFLDESDGFKKALGSGKLGLHGLLYPSVWKNAERAKQKYPEMESDLKGNGLDLGGSVS